MATDDDLEMVAWEQASLNQCDDSDLLLDSNSEEMMSGSPQAVPLSEHDSLSMMLTSYGYSCAEPNVAYATEMQTDGDSHVHQPPAKKIKPVNHPSLKLKTPIAFRPDSDLSAIPIRKEGMAVCEKCGAIGVKHAFYTKERRFCSLACARGHDVEDKFEQNSSSPYEHRPERNSSPLLERVWELESLDQPSDNLSHSESSEELASLKLVHVPNTYNWNIQLPEPGFIAAPVSCFVHSPMADAWDNITVGMKVEVENKDTDNFSEMFPDSFWVANVLNISGYKALLRYEGFGQDSSKDFWVNLCSEDVHPVGWCATRGKPLIPPKTIQNKYSDWKEFLLKRLTGARTLPSNFHTKVVESMHSRFRCGMHLEVVDKNRISQVRVATIQKIVGKRLHIQYEDSSSDDMGFWCHEDSPLIHPVGWAHAVDHQICATDEYHQKVRCGDFDEDDATPDLFPVPTVPSRSICFREGMKLEAIDPLNLSAICAATLMKVLRNNYVMVRIDSYEMDESGSDWFCYHAFSPCLFPAGFCEMNNIPLTPPKGCEEKFKWADYLQENKLVEAPLSFFNRDIPNHGFKVGMRLESADLMDPRLICVGTVSRVVGRLLKIHFDGWEEEYDQWLDCHSPDIYPVGWCELVGHKLEGPRQPATITSKKAKKKPMKRRHKKLRGHVVGMKKKLPVVPNHQIVLRGYDKESTKNTEISSSDETAVPSLEDNFESEDLLTVPAVQAPSPIPRERAVTSYVNSTNTSGKIIPRLVDATGSQDFTDVQPEQWNVFDVAQFLRVNDCTAYCDSFNRTKVDGSKLFTLTKDQIIALTGMKVGPSLKIFDLIQQLKTRVAMAKARLRVSSLLNTKIS